MLLQLGQAGGRRRHVMREAIGERSSAFRRWSLLLNERLVRLVAWRRKEMSIELLTDTRRIEERSGRRFMGGGASRCMESLQRTRAGQLLTKVVGVVGPTIAERLVRHG